MVVKIETHTLGEFNPEKQHFKNKQEWINHGRRLLQEHPRHCDWFKVLCFDSVGNICLSGKEFMEAEENETYPIYWVWPDQNIFDAIEKIKEQAK